MNLSYESVKIQKLQDVMLKGKLMDFGYMTMLSYFITHKDLNTCVLKIW
jgi:hypothetical protein